MVEPYARAMLFLTYIQGGNTTEWVDQLGEWLDFQIDSRNPRCTTANNEWLWESVELAFNRQYVDKLTQERAMAELKAGIKMKGEELDDYISHFKALVRHAGLAINDQLVVDISQQGSHTICIRSYTTSNHHSSCTKIGGLLPLSNKSGSST